MAKIYVGTYAKYNNGSIFGEWLNAEDYSDKEEFIEACKELHKDEASPEVMFQDFEGFPSVFYGESDIDSRLWDYLGLDEFDREIVEVWLTENTLDRYEDLQSIVDSFTGHYSSWELYAEEMAYSLGDVPEHLAGYIDYEKMGRDMMICSSGYVEFEGEVWLFEG